MKPMCTCYACSRRRVVNLNQYYRRTGQGHRCKVIPGNPTGVHRDHPCPCDYCVQVRQAHTKYYFRHRTADSLESIVHDDFVPNAECYDWDRTTLDDYGPNAQKRLLKSMRKVPLESSANLEDVMVQTAI